MLMLKVTLIHFGGQLPDSSSVARTPEIRHGVERLVQAFPWTTSKCTFDMVFCFPGHLPHSILFCSAEPKIAANLRGQDTSAEPRVI